MKLIAVLVLLSLNVMAAKPDERFPFKFKNADILQVIEVYGKQTGKKFVVDPTVKGKISILSEKAMTPEEAYEALLMSLATNGYAIIEQGDFLRVGQAITLSRSSSEVLNDVPDIKQEKMVTVVFPLKNVLAREINTSMGQILVSRMGELRVAEAKNALVVTDWTSNLHRTKKILSEIDVPAKK